MTEQQEPIARGERVQTKDRKIPATVRWFVAYGYVVERDDGTRWIYPRDHTEREASGG